MIWYDEGVYYESVRRGGEEERTKVFELVIWRNHGGREE